MKILYALTAAAMLMGAAPAAAQDRMVVRHGDLNLASAAGAKALERRIERAAEQLCGDTLTLELAMARAARACRAEAVTAAAARATVVTAQRAGAAMASGSR